MKSGIMLDMDRWSYTVEDYVRLEDETPIKHEFYDGDIRAMTGGTPRHALYGANVIVQLGRQLGNGRCRVYSSDLRIRVDKKVITYPDASVVCGEVKLDTEDPKAQLNPTVIVEVTSRSSERYDRGGKYQHYQRVASLSEYVIVSHRERLVHVFRRGEDGVWFEAQQARPGEQAQLSSIHCTINVDELYGDTVLPS
jgi:Uma2 family endonuclease